MSHASVLGALKQNIRSFLPAPPRKKKCIIRRQGDLKENEPETNAKGSVTAALLGPLLEPVVEYVATLCRDGGCSENENSETVLKTYSCAVRLSDIVLLKCHKQGCPLTDADQLMECMSLLALKIKKHPQAQRWVQKVRDAEAVISMQEKNRERKQCGQLEWEDNDWYASSPGCNSPHRRCHSLPHSPRRDYDKSRESSRGGADHSGDHDMETMQSVEMQRWYVVCSLLLQEDTEQEDLDLGLRCLR